MQDADGSHIPQTCTDLTCSPLILGPDAPRKTSPNDKGRRNHADLPWCKIRGDSLNPREQNHSKKRICLLRSTDLKVYALPTYSPRVIKDVRNKVYNHRRTLWNTLHRVVGLHRIQLQLIIGQKRSHPRARARLTDLDGLIL